MAITLTTGLFVGFVLNYFVPSIDLGIATLCGLLAIAIPLYAIFQAMLTIKEVNTQLDGNGQMYDDDEDDDAVVLTEDQADMLAEQLVEAMLVKISTLDARPKRHSGRSR